MIENSCERSKRKNAKYKEQKLIFNLNVHNNYLPTKGSFIFLFFLFSFPISETDYKFPFSNRTGQFGFVNTLNETVSNHWS